jgi:Tfp pilus assembly major pilin PilA
MKTVSKIALLALVGLSFTSCNKEKDWKCTCTLNGKENTGTLPGRTKKDAKAECKDAENNGSTTMVITNCHLDGQDRDW